MLGGAKSLIATLTFNINILCVALLISVDTLAAGSFSVQRIERSTFGYDKFDAINEILQDQTGFLWLASENGLLRYDGLRTIKYQTVKGDPNSISSLYCWSLVEDHKGHIWIATENGLNEYDPKYNQFTRYLHDPEDQNSLSHNFTTRVIETDDHYLYVATANGLTRISPDRTRFERITADSDNAILMSNDVRTVSEDRDGHLWVGYTDKGVTKWNPKTQETTHINRLTRDPESRTQTPEIRDIEQDHLGRIWLGLYGGGVIRIHPDTMTLTHFKLPFATLGHLGSVVWDIFVDQQGDIWVSTDKGGVGKFDEQQQEFVNYRHDPYDTNTFLSNTIKDIYQDRQGNLWFATFPEGLNRHHPYTLQFETWRHKVNQENSLNDSTILSVFHAKNGVLWVGTESGLNAIDETTNRITRYNYHPEEPNSIPAQAVLSITEDNQGFIWVGTWGGGLAKLDPETGLFDRFLLGDKKHATKSANIWKVFFDSKDRLWLGTETDGLNLYIPEEDRIKSFTSTASTDSISFNYVWDISESHTGALWVGTQYGLNLFDPETERFQRFQNLDEFQSLGSARVQSVLEDSEGYVWVATQSRGVKRWDPKTRSIITLSMTSGMPSNTVSALAKDNRGYIWASSPAGIVKINPATLMVEDLLTKSDGIAGNNHNRNAALTDEKGYIYFGSTSGLTRFFPDTLTTRDEPPTPTFTDVKILNTSANVGTEANLLNEDISVATYLELPFDAHVFSLEFSNLDFSSAGQMQFSYILEGFEKEWHEIKNHNQAIYTNLDPGQYVFKVRSQTRNGQWSENVKKLDIFINPPPWKSPAAYTIYAFILIAFIYLLTRVIILRMMTSKLNEEVVKRTEELVKANQAKTRFLANVSHELRTPLNSIIGFSKRIIAKYENELGKQGMTAMEAIHRNGNHLLGLINDILDLSKIESGKMQLKFIPCNLREILTSCIADLREAASEKGLSILPPNSYAHQVIRADRQRLTQIFYNLISNGVKYTDQGHVAIVVDEQNVKGIRYCTISVIDTGKGIRKEEQSKLFKRFEQMDDETSDIKGFGTGLGLALVAEFAQLQGGFVTCHSIYGEGSQFTVFLPLSEPKIPD